ncbi:deleted in malignant brain tumors 1 protein-like [Mizuhopecten yessoensis]|uniref:Deleted in malignant brain tumors 1 protein n=1 Tax=Mizuhopecten yessoensis TaxID=6573 RepID=A0A210R3S6_MIZYE|nr:deleted in malignant brain tumors 1 protein-like [Mizuhopecten yessoensis]OWF55622.1 Deleted in malignant brain tumors 1 protein [Mizuhopecten yessoensis]
MVTNMAAKWVWSLLLLVKIHFDSGYAQCVNTLDVTAHLDYSGHIKSPNYPYNYNNRANCEWLITASTGVVVISIDDMLLETNFDNIYFYDGSSSSGTLLGSYTAETTGIEISSGTTMLVRFTTDSSVTRHGFKLTYFALYSASSSNLHAWPYSPCGTTININTNDIQQLKLSSAPLSTSPSLSNCDVTFSVSASNLNVTILWSDLAFTSNGLNVTSVNLCDQQYGLSVWDGNGSTLLYWLCNADQSSDDTVIIYPTQTSVMFRYNSPISTTGPIISIQNYGGTAATATVPIPTTQSIVSSCGDRSMISESFQQYLTSPNYPNYYSNYLSCIWTITSHDLNGVITLNIISLYT